jgi:phosphate transport system permease protein
MKSGWLTRAVVVLTAVGAAGLLSVVGRLVVTALPVLSWHFVLAAPSHRAPGGGVGPLLGNTVYEVTVALAVSVPVGLGAAILRAEYLSAAWGTALEATADVLASLPSVVVGLGLFLLLIDLAHWPFSRLSGMAALVVLNTPWVAATAMRLLAAVPTAWREASWALGATRLQTLVRVVLPSLVPGLAATVGLGAARMAGESAALLYTAGTNGPATGGLGLWLPGGTLAVHLFYVRTEGLMPDADGVAAATGVVLLLLVAAWLAAGQALARWWAHRAGIR